MKIARFEKIIADDIVEQVAAHRTIPAQCDSCATHTTWECGGLCASCYLDAIGDDETRCGLTTDFVAGLIGDDYPGNHERLLDYLVGVWFRAAHAAFPKVAR